MSKALRTFAGDALKKTRDAAMAIIKVRHADTPQRTYFAGGSTGGCEALLAVGNCRWGRRILFLWGMRWHVSC